MKRTFAVILEMAGNTEEYEHSDTKPYNSLYSIGNGLYKTYLNGNRTSTVETIEKQTKALRFKGCKITEIVDIIEIN